MLDDADVLIASNIYQAVSLSIFLNRRKKWSRPEPRNTTHVSSLWKNNWTAIHTASQGHISPPRCDIILVWAPTQLNLNTLAVKCLIFNGVILLSVGQDDDIGGCPTSAHSHT
jgi:hypothetical protein